MSELLWGIWLFLPAGIANAAPVLVAKIPGLKNWDTPLDMGQTWHGKRLLGPNKTWRGVICGSLLAGIFAVFQHMLWVQDPNNETLFIHFCLGLLLGTGALLGDAIESFFKRKKGVKSGDSWFPYDQTDYIIGGLLFSYPLMQPSGPVMFGILITYFVLHLLTRYIGYLSGINDKPV
jgi:CDP-2,3-bis-(O-geranylgeranyl)-sn-glycerol synthase